MLHRHVACDRLAGVGLGPRGWVGLLLLGLLELLLLGCWHSHEGGGWVGLLEPAPLLLLLLLRGLAAQLLLQERIPLWWRLDAPLLLWLLRLLPGGVVIG